MLRTLRAKFTQRQREARRAHDERRRDVMTTIPEGWTDEMSIPLPPGLREKDLVDVVLSSTIAKLSYDETIDKLASLGLSMGDASLAWDRVHGGVVRAATGNPRNAPSADKDPIAYTSYRRCLEEPSLIPAVRPDLARPSTRRMWWQFWK